MNRWLALVIAVLSWRAGLADEAWTVDIDGEFRARYETVRDQYRAGPGGDDELIALRTLLHVRAENGELAFGAELQDARAYLDDAQTPLSTSFVNTADFIQAYVEFPSASPFERPASLKAGRMTLDIGSRRIVERNNFRNTINSYTGFHYVAEGRDRRLEAIATLPVRAKPLRRSRLASNDHEFDTADDQRLFWGLFMDWGSVDAARTHFETYLFGLHETDDGGRRTANRRFFIPGFRVARAPREGSVDFELEVAGRYGEQRATDDPTDREDIDVRAAMLHAETGYTFSAIGPLILRVAFKYDYASGDDDPTDDVIDRYERLFGTRRGDLGNTSTFGPFTRTNVHAPALRLEYEVGQRWDGRFMYQPTWLASDTDAWVQARLRDPTGQSGNFLGHLLDTRLRYWAIRDRVRLEIGGSALLKGEFAKNVPGAPPRDTSLYGYTQVIMRF